MKKLLFSAILLLPLLVNAQAKQDPYNYRVQDNYLYYGDVVKVDTTFTVMDLYKSAKLFITKLAVQNTKITTDDPKSGTVVADFEEPTKYKTKTGIGSNPMTVKYTIKLELKQGRYRYTIDNIQASYTDDGKETTYSLNDLNKEKGGGIVGVGEEKRMLSAMDAAFMKKINLLTTTMSKRSDDF